MATSTCYFCGSRLPEESRIQQSLRDLAASVLADGALPSSRLVEIVCRMPGTPAPVADDIAFALLGSAPEFSRTPDGSWRLNHEQVRLVKSGSRLDSLSYLVVDVETTGVSTIGGDRITEIAAYRVDGRSGAISPVLDTLVNPGRHIPQYITTLTGISWEMVKDLPPFDAHASLLLQEIAGSVFVAHNANFDWRFVSHEVLRATGRTPVASRLCTVRLCRALLPGLHRRSLDHVAYHFGVEIEARHRAGGDAHATAKIFSRLLRRARYEGIASLEELERFIYSRRSKPRRKKRRAMPYY